MADGQTANRAYYIWGALLVLVAMGITLWGVPNHRWRVWACMIFALTAFLMLAGKAERGSYLGVLIDEQNRVSLSRLQMAVWTVLISASFFVAAMNNLHVGAPCTVQMPEEIWALLGISSASLVGSPLISYTKSTRQAAQSRAQEVGAAPPGTGQATGMTAKAEPSLSELFTVSDAGGAPYLDLARVQMFIFTIILVVAYFSAIAGLFRNVAGVLRAFPPLDEGMVWLLGISHAAYLGKKAVPSVQPTPGQ